MRTENSPARERVLDVAERLFSERGFRSVTLRDIAHELGMRHASLYHHVPGGKEALFVEVMERSMRRHQHGLESAIAHAERDLQAQLQAAAHWLFSQPAMNYNRMFQSDMPSISEEAASHLGSLAYESLLQPLYTIFREALHTDDLATLGIIAGSFLSIIEGIHNLPLQYQTHSKERMAEMMITVLVHGLQHESLDK